MLFLDTGSENGQTTVRTPRTGRQRQRSELEPADPETKLHIKGLTGAGADVRHINQRPGVLDERLMMQRHACAEVLWIH